MKYTRSNVGHPTEVAPHHWVAAWFGLFFVLVGVVAIYWYRRCRTITTNKILALIQRKLLKSKSQSANMFNLYQSMNKGKDQEKKEDTIGHDRFYQERASRSSYRRKRKVTRRAQSAAELNPAAVTAANKRVSFRTRSSSSEQKDEEDTEKTPLVSQKIDSLARLLFNRTLGGNKSASSSDVSTSRHGVRYQYSALDLDSSHERLELERRVREGAATACHQYLQMNPRYEMLRHLNDIGSRFEKHWFVVKDVSIKTDRLMSLVPVCSNCNIECNQDTKEIILELFQSLQHPYIYPVLDFDFTFPSDLPPDCTELTPYAALVMPYHTEGSLKDLIYGSAWQDDWGHKYGRRSPGLPLGQIQRLGRQILEALLFLRERGFPPYGHLHTGNVILQNGVARLAGLENTLLGFTSRIHSVIWRRARAAPSSVDIICFGHVLFEMSAGYELNAPQPSPGHLQLDLERYPQVVEILELIFSHPDGRYPTVEELLMCDLFRNIDLREMRMRGSSNTHRLPHQVRLLLDDVRRPRRACASEPSSPLARDRRMSEDLHRVFSSDDCSIEEGNQHRELLLHLRTPQQLVNPRYSQALRDIDIQAPLLGHLQVR